MGNNITDLAELLEPTDDNDKVEINEETGEVVKPEETDDGKDKSAKTSEQESSEDDKKKIDEPGDESEEAKKPEEEETAKPIEQSLEEQNRELRQIMRQQAKDMRIMQSKLDRLEKKSVAATKKAEETADDILFGEGDNKDPKDEDKIEFSDIEVAQNELSALAQEKGTVLETLLEVMEINPKYADVRTVCSQSNFSDMFAAVGEALAEKEGVDPTVAAMQAEVAIWKMPNPYKYMYDLIKKYHPSYITKETKPKEKELPTKTPTSLANVPGKTEGDNKWTSARIDEMPEEDLHLVPEDIYDKYLEGGLD